MKKHELISIINDLLEQFGADTPCDCGGSILCAVCRAQEAVRVDFKETFPNEKELPYSYQWFEEE
jgi:hypothetical protein